ncbi:hypothetical protein [Pleionea sediminis]|uniref:hypothetical protein n=1 Tax=Pleionea sediminis TaxID=2569479 RepID=UPI0011867CF1|nr:hypothetical protein [Pleionea sediminis]
MNGVKVLKIFGLWLLPGLIVLGYTLFTSPMAGALLLGVTLSLSLAILGAPLHIAFAWKNKNWSGFKSASTSAFLLLMIFIIAAETGIFNFT